MPIGKIATQQPGRDRRKGLRAPVYLDVRCELSNGTVLKGKVINLGTDGIGVKITDPVPTKDNVVVEFLIPDNLTSIRAAGDVMWCRSHPKEHSQKNPCHLAGIKFKDLSRDCRVLLCDYILRKVLCNDDLLQLNGIPQVMNYIRHLPPIDRLKYYRILTNS